MSTEGLLFSRFLIFIFSIIALVVCIYTFCYNFIYQSIDVVTANMTVIEYGSSNGDIIQFVDKVDGEIVSIKNKIEPYVVGMQEIVLVVAKGNIFKEIPIEIEVKDTTEPVISFVSEAISIKQGEKVDLLSNVESVVDSVDGKLSYIDDVSESMSGYYTIESDIDYNVVGNYTVRVVAVDKNNNRSEEEFTVNVLKNEISMGIVDIAYSLLGKPYLLGAHGPYAFDCSGFIQYLYSQFGINISCGSSTQLYDGFAVSYDEVLPGDIISWGYNDSLATHSSLYVGDGKMIHAANPNEGVILSDVLEWERGSSTHIIGVRRIR